MIDDAVSGAEGKQERGGKLKSNCADSETTTCQKDNTVLDRQMNREAVSFAPVKLNEPEGGGVEQAPVFLPRRPCDFDEVDDVAEMDANNDDPGDDAIAELAHQHDEAKSDVWQERIVCQTKQTWRS